VDAEELVTLHVAVDMDDVLVDFSGGIRAAIEREFGITIPLGDPWDPAFSAFGEVHGVPFGKGGAWGWLQENRHLWSNFPAIPGAVGGLRQLRQAGHKVELLTSKPDWAIPQVYSWLGKWRLQVPKVTIVGKDEVKAEHTDADILVDDKPSHVLDFAKSGRAAVWFNRFGLSWTAGFSTEDYFNPDYPIATAVDWPAVVRIVTDVAHEAERNEP
jgi:FMN phosphatase YigB (HAD superfamily)